MLSFDIRSLESHAAVVDEDLSSADPVWEADDPKPTTAVRVTGRLSSAGPGRGFFDGRISADLWLESTPGMAGARRPGCDEAHLIFAEAGDEETDDPDVYQIDPRADELDLRPAIREEWLVAAPSFALCREDCKGLCARCGADLNAGPHECSDAVADPSWKALRKMNQG